jgi:hypothetical protein
MWRGGIIFPPHILSISTTNSRGRKQGKNVKEWKGNRNQTKMCTGGSYVNRSGKSAPAKAFINTDCKYQRNCASFVGDEEMRKLFKLLYILSDLIKHNVYICGLIQYSKVWQC